MLTVDRLRQAAVHPVREMLTQRLGLHFPRAVDDVVDQLPTDLDALARHRLGTDLLTARAQGWDTDRWLAAMAARGTLPPDLLVADRLAEVTRIVGQIAGSAVELGVGLDPSERHPIDLDVAGRRLVGVVERCASGDRPGPVTLTYSKAKAAQRMLDVVASDEPPVRLMLGADAYAIWEAILANRQADLGKWRDRGIDTAFEGAATVQIRL